MYSENTLKISIARISRNYRDNCRIFLVINPHSKKPDSGYEIQIKKIEKVV